MCALEGCPRIVEIDTAIISKIVNSVSPVSSRRSRIIQSLTALEGPWTKEEEEQLTRIVTDMTIKQGKDIDNDVFWGKVSELMGGRRGRQQCRIKWCAEATIRLGFYSS